MAKKLNKDTQVCMSLAARPSNFGTRFHNYLYDALGLDYLYKAFTTQNLEGAIQGIRALGIRGCAISMPFKEACIPLVDEMDASAQGIQAVNTIVNTNGHLKAYNTDYIAIRQLLVDYALDPNRVFALKGSGGMAKAAACALKDAGFRKGYIVARNAGAGQALAALYGYQWCATEAQCAADILINATPLGMEGTQANQLSWAEDKVQASCTVFDMVALPAVTPLTHYAQELGKTVITGSEVFAIQAVEQFVLYTGIRPSAELFSQAAAWSRQ